MVVEAELCAAVCEIFERLGFRDFEIRFNDRRILSGILAEGIPDEYLLRAIIAIDKLEKIGSDGVINELKGIGVTEHNANQFLRLFAELSKYYESEGGDYPTPEAQRIAWNKNTIPTFRQRLVSKQNTAGPVAIADLQQLLKHLKQLGCQGKMFFDPSLARGLSYYTGAIFEIRVPDLSGSLGGGGRYDGLIGMFGKEQIPACGFSLGLERIIVVMEERGMFPQDLAAAPADVMVTIRDEERIGDSLKLARELRETGLRVLVYPQPDKLGKQFRFADQNGIPLVCVLGETELSGGTVRIKNMASGEQSDVERTAAAAAIRSML